MRIDAYNQVTQLYKTNSTKKAYKTNTAQAADKVEISQMGKDYQIAKNAVAAAPIIGLNGFTTLSATNPTAFFAKLPAFLMPCLILFQRPQAMYFNEAKIVFRCSLMLHFYITQICTLILT